MTIFTWYGDLLLRSGEVFKMSQSGTKNCKLVIKSALKKKENLNNLNKVEYNSQILEVSLKFLNSIFE